MAIDASTTVYMIDHSHNEPMAAPPGTKACIVCGEPADTVRDGADYCGDHRLSHRAAQPIAPCVVSGCGSPVAPGSRWCGCHRPHLDPRFGRAA